MVTRTHTSAVKMVVSVSPVSFHSPSKRAPTFFFSPYSSDQSPHPNLTEVVRRTTNSAFRECWSETRTDLKKMAVQG